MTISEAAVTAAAKALFADKMSNHSGDNAPQIIDACETVARKILEAASRHMLAGAWGDAMQYAYEEGYFTRPQLEALQASNPHRTAL